MPKITWSKALPRLGRPAVQLVDNEYIPRCEEVVKNFDIG